MTGAVTPAEPAELGPIAALVRAVIAAVPYYNAEAIAAELAKYDEPHLRALLGADPYAILIARDEDGLTGFCVSRWDDATIWLSWFGVAARARGRGVGTALIAALKASLPARRAHKIWCDSRTENVESIATLERAGFRRLTTLTDHWFHQDYFLWEWRA